MKSIRPFFMLLCQMLFLVLITRYISQPVFAATYYVDNTVTDTYGGSGTPDFTTYDHTTFATTGGSDSVYKTVADVGAKVFSQDDQILFRKGQTWREQWLYSSSGASGHPITYGAFGSGAAPIISASDLITAGWSKDSAKIWKSAVTTQPYVVYFNGTRGTLVAAKANITTEFNWFWEANVLYVWSPPDSDPSLYYTNPGIEAGSRANAIRTGDKSYVTVDGLTIRDGNSNNVGGQATINVGSVSVTGIIFQNCVIERGSWTGLILRGSTTAASVTIDHCTVQNNGGHGIFFSNLYTTATISNNIVTGNGWNSVVDNQQYSGIQGNLGNVNIFGNSISANAPVCSGASQCHGIYSSNNATVVANIYQNTIYNDLNGDGIKLIGSANVYKNNIYGNYAAGVEAGQNSSTNVVYTIYSNLVYGNNTSAGSQGIVEQTKGTGTISLTVDNNTLYQNGNTANSEMAVNDNLTALTIKNNILFATPTRRTIKLVPQTGTVSIDNNLHWRADGNPYISYNGSDVTWVQWRALGYDTHGVNLDPLLTNATGNVFTLQSTSPAIDAGTNVSLTSDYAGTSVPQGSAPDIGAYEYVFSTTSAGSTTSSTTSSGPSAPSINCPSGYTYCISAGPHGSGGSGVVTGEDSNLGVQAVLGSTTHHDDVHLTITKQTTETLLQKHIPFPWAQGMNTASEIYNFNALSAFNGYPIPTFDHPATVILPYDPTKLHGISPNQLRIAWYDPITDTWKVLHNNTVVNPKTHIVANTTTKFSYFAVVFENNTPVLGVTTRQLSVSSPITPSPIPSPTPIVHKPPSHPSVPSKHCFLFVCW